MYKDREHVLSSFVTSFVAFHSSLSSTLRTVMLLTLAMPGIAGGGS